MYRNVHILENGSMTVCETEGIGSDCSVTIPFESSESSPALERGRSAIMLVASYEIVVNDGLPEEAVKLSHEEISLEIPKQVKRLREALSANHWKNLEQTAQWLQSAAERVQEDALRRASLRMVMAARKQDRERAETVLESF